MSSPGENTRETRLRATTRDSRDEAEDWGEKIEIKYNIFNLCKYNTSLYNYVYVQKVKRVSLLIIKFYWRETTTNHNIFIPSLVSLVLNAIATIPFLVDKYIKLFDWRLCLFPMPDDSLMLIVLFRFILLSQF